MIVALAAKVRVAAVVTVVLLAAHLAWFVPRVSAEPRAGAGWPAARVRVMTANLYADRTPSSELVAAVRAEQPDVLALQEAPRGAAGSAALPGRPSRPPRTWRRHLRPLAPARCRRPLAFLGRRLGNPRATLELAGAVLTVQSVHTNPPMPLGVGPWQQDLRVLGQVAAGTPGPLIAMGDYNASSDHRSFRALLAVGGLRDADDARGRGLVRTWPTDRGWRLPAFAQLDHVLVSCQLAVLGVHERTLPGTDHRAVIADLALRGNQHS
jgi:endonuclease/exonuclease/phosphatase (EEP) superfamily protein YafD